MVNKLSVAILASLTMSLTALPAFAQEVPGEGVVNGVFRLTIGGDVPADYSFYVETDAAVGGHAPICTTDAQMVEEGYTECVGGGAVNELPFSVLEGETMEYRVLGSRGAALSQEVVAEGSMTPEDGFTVDASFDFSGSELGGTPTEDAPEDGAAQDQYEDRDDETTDDGGSAEGTGEEDGGSGDPTGGTGLLPDTGGASLTVIAGILLLFAAGGFLAYRVAR